MFTSLIYYIVWLKIALDMSKKLMSRYRQSGEQKDYTTNSTIKQGLYFSNIIFKHSKTAIKIKVVKNRAV